MPDNQFDEFYVIRLDKHSHKLLFPLKAKISFKKITLGLLSDEEFSKGIRDGLAYAGGWWVGCCKKQQITVTEMEFILPPFSEYLKIAEKLTGEFEDNGVKLSIKIGAPIYIPNREINGNIVYIDKQLQEFRQTDASNN